MNKFKMARNSEKEATYTTAQHSTTTNNLACEVYDTVYYVLLDGGWMEEEAIYRGTFKDILN